MAIFWVKTENLACFKIKLFLKERKEKTNMRHTQPSPGALKYIARDLRISYQELVNILSDLGYLYSDGTITPEGRIRGMKEYDEGGLGANEQVLNEVISVLNKNIEWYCDKCNAHLNEQPGFTTRLRTWTCKKCGYKNVVVDTGDNIRYE